MKTSKKIAISISLIIGLLVHVQFAVAQKNDSLKAAVIKNALDSQQYVFNADFANPMMGGRRSLTSGYTLRVSKNKIVSDLPFFGKATTIPINGDGGIKFTSNDFDYSATKAKKDGWLIRIKPKDVSDVQQIIINIFDNGSASLQVVSTQRDNISFDGYVVKKN